MNNYKYELSGAIKSVFSDLLSMSPEKLRSKIENYLYDDRTNAILYAWDSNANEYPGEENSAYEMKDFSTFFKAIEPSRAKVPALFTDDQQCCCLYDDNKYDKEIVSDDYFMFQAAA